MTSAKLLPARSEEIAFEETEPTESKKRDLNDLPEKDFVKFVYFISSN